jgi:hypothetical protein
MPTSTEAATADLTPSRLPALDPLLLRAVLATWHPQRPELLLRLHPRRDEAGR